MKKNNYNEIKQLEAEVRKIEKTLEKLNAEKKSMEEKFIEITDSQKITEMQKSYAALQVMLENAESSWLELAEKIQSLS